MSKHHWQVVHELPLARGDAAREWWRRLDKWILGARIMAVVVGLELIGVGFLKYKEHQLEQRRDRAAREWRVQGAGAPRLRLGKAADWEDM